MKGGGGSVRKGLKALLVMLKMQLEIKTSWLEKLCRFKVGNKTLLRTFALNMLEHVIANVCQS